MGASMNGGLLLLIAIGVLFAIIAIVAFAKPDGSGSGDLEHFDHEPGDPSAR